MMPHETTEQEIDSAEGLVCVSLPELQAMGLGALEVSTW